MILQKGWKRNAANGPIPDSGECSAELNNLQTKYWSLLLGMSYFLVAEFWVC